MTMNPISRRQVMIGAAGLTFAIALGRIDEAAAAGARYVVVGRMVTAAPDRRGAMREVRDQLAARR